jgi:hypothetical protein
MKLMHALVARSTRASLLLLALLVASPVFAAPKYVLAESSAEQDFGANGSVDQTAATTNTYDKKGNLLQTVTLQTGTFEQVQTTTFTNNSDGDAVSSISEVDMDADGTIDITSTTTFTYDSQGNRIAFDQIVENDGDATPDIIRHQTSVFDNQGNPTLVVTVSDTDDDGNLDGGADQIVTVQNTFSAQGLLQSITTFDQNGDGDANDVGDSVNTRVATFDSNGDIIGFETTNDSQNDGIIDASSTATFVYGAHNLVIGLQSEFDDNDDGTIDQITTVVNTWVKR